MGSRTPLKKSPEMINLTGDPDSPNSGNFVSWFNAHICSTTFETAEKMVVNMNVIDKRQDENENLLDTVISNLKEIKNIVTSYESLNKSTYSEARSFAGNLNTLHRMKNFIGHASRSFENEQANRKDDLDLETANQLMNLFIREIGESSTKLKENIAAVRTAQEVNRKHLKQIENDLKEKGQALEEYIQNEAELEATPGCSTWRQNKERGCSGHSNAGNITQKKKEAEKRSQATQADDEPSSTPKKSRIEPEIEKGFFTPTRASQTSQANTKSPLSQKSNFGNRRESDTNEESENRNRSRKESHGETSEDLQGKDSQFSQAMQNMYVIVSNADEKVSDIEKKLYHFEDIIHESKIAISSLNRDMSSLRALLKEEGRRREIAEEKGASMAGTSFAPSSSQQSPRCGLFWPTFVSPNVTAADKSYYDTRSEISQNAIQRARGPLTADKLTDFLDTVRNDTSIINKLLQTLPDKGSLKQQLICVKKDLEMSYRDFLCQPGNRPIDFDRRLLQRMEKLISLIDA